MASNSVRIRVSQRLRRNLNRLPQNIANDIKGAIVETALTRIETVAKQTLTREGHVDTGRLRASIHTRYDTTNSNYIYRDNNGELFNGSLMENPRNDLHKFQIFVGTNVEYAGYIERRFPYLLPAFESAKIYMDRKIQSILRSVGRRL